MSKKSRIIILSIIILFIISSMLYITYGYVTAEISGNETSKKITSLSQVLKVEYSGGTNELLSSQDNYFVPSSTLTKTFTIKNTGNVSVKYSIVLDNVKNSFERKNDITYELSSNDVVLKNGMYDATGIFPDNKSTILNIDTLTTGQSKTYTLKINYLTSEENQIVDSGKSLSAEILIEESKPIINNLIVYGNSIQDGTPTPDTPIEIESVGDKTNNLFDYTKVENKSNNGVSAFNNHDGTFTLDGNMTKDLVSIDIYNSVNYSLIKPNVEYYVSSGNDLHGTDLRYYLMVGIQNSTTGKIRYVSTSSSNSMILNENETITMFQIRIFSPSANLYNIDNELFAPILCEKSKYNGYEPYGYKIPVKVSGKNLFNINNIIEDFNKIEYTNNGIILTNNSSTGYSTSYIDIPNLEKGEYTFSCDYKQLDNVTTIRFDARRYKATSLVDIYNFVMKIDESGKVLLNFTIPEGDKGTRIYLYSNASGTASNVKLEMYNVQLEKSSTATEYEPYVEPITTNIFLDEPLRKIGDYADYIDFENSKVVRRTIRRLPNSTAKNNSLSLSWWRINVNTEDFISVYLEVSSSGNVGNHQALSNKFEYKRWNNIPATARDNYLWSAGASTGFLIRTALIEGYDYSWNETKKKVTVLDWLDANGVDWIHPLRAGKETTEDITLPNIPTHNGTNIIEICSNNGVCASNIKVEYDE